MKAFINVQIDAEKGEGPALAKRYSAGSFPTILVLDASGEEIDRIVGYRDPHPFLEEIRRIAAGKNTLPALRKKHLADPDDADAGAAYAVRLAQTDPVEAAKLLADLAGKPTTTDRELRARLHLERGVALEKSGSDDEAAKEAEAVVREFPDTTSASHAAERLMGALGAAFRADALRGLAFARAARSCAKESKDKIGVEAVALNVLEDEQAAVLERWAQAASDDPESLWEAASVCLEKKALLSQAVGWARAAVEKLRGRDDEDSRASYPLYLDTFARLLWETDAREEAVRVETDALALVKGWAPTEQEFGAVLAGWRAQMEYVAAHPLPAGFKREIVK